MEVNTYYFLFQQCVCDVFGKYCVKKKSEKNTTDPRNSPSRQHVTDGFSKDGLAHAHSRLLSSFKKKKKLMFIFERERVRAGEGQRDGDRRSEVGFVLTAESSVHGLNS